jgi:hypothetical protein
MLGLGIGREYPDKLSWTPRTVEGLSLWLKYNTDITVSEWKDQSGNGKNAVQTSSDNQGTVVGGGYHFEQTEPGDYLELSTGEAAAINFTANNDFTIAFVVNLESFDSTQNCIFSQTGNEFMEFQTTKKIRIKFNDGSTTSTHVLTESAAQFAAGATFILVIQRSGSDTGTLNVYKNGNLLGGSWSDQTGPIAFDLDNIGVRADSDRLLDGTLYEVIMYANTTLSADDLADLHEYLLAVHTIG